MRATRSLTSQNLLVLQPLLDMPPTPANATSGWTKAVTIWGPQFPLESLSRPVHYGSHAGCWHLNVNVLTWNKVKTRSRLCSPHLKCSLPPSGKWAPSWVTQIRCFHDSREAESFTEQSQTWGSRDEDSLEMFMFYLLHCITSQTEAQRGVARGWAYV